MHLVLPKLSRCAFAGLLLCLVSPSNRALALATSQRVIHTFSWGDRAYTCLNIDGGQVPLPVPPSGGPTIQGGSSLSIKWPTDGTIAIIRDASKSEAALLDLMGTEKAADAWKRYMGSTLHGTGYTSTVHDFQPDCLDVNHWHIGAITMDYELGGRKSSSLLMIWRCKDGTTLAVTMQSDPSVFKAHYTELTSLIGGSLVMPFLN